MINFVIWLILGAFIGWLASVIMNTDGEQSTLHDIGIGVVGSFLAGLILTPLFGVSTINEGNFSFPGVMMSLLGAIILLVVVKLFRSEIARRH